MLPLDKMADQNVPRYQHINVSDFVNFFLKSGLFIMEGEGCALYNWWSDVVMAVLICYLFAIIHNSIWLLSIAYLSIKVNCAPFLVSLQEKLFIPLQSKSLFCFLWTILVAYVTVTSIWVFLGIQWILKSILVASRPKYSVCMVSLHSQRHFKTHLLFLPGVAELKLDAIYPIIL